MNEYLVHKELLISRLEARIVIIENFQKNARLTGEDLPVTFKGGNERKAELRYLINMIDKM